ncbi:hypothetical protein LOTGIDRAFT_166445, partial [Lottia gigantea]
SVQQSTGQSLSDPSAEPQPTINTYPAQRTLAPEHIGLTGTQLKTADYRVADNPHYADVYHMAAAGRNDVYSSYPQTIKYPSHSVPTTIGMSQSGSSTSMGMRRSPGQGGGWNPQGPYARSEGTTDYTGTASGNYNQISPNTSSPGNPNLWPQWQGAQSSDNNQQNPQATAPQSQTNPEEFGDMFRMLDQPATEFTDLSGMFNTFTE